MSSSVKKITLESGDGQVFQVDEAVATEFHFKQVITDDCTDDNRIRFPKVRGKILAKVIEYCNKHAESAKPEEDRATDEELKTWDAEFVRLDPATLCELITAAHHLNIKGLLDLTAEAIAALIRGKTTEQIRETFNIKNDLTPEEEAQLLREWDEKEEFRRKWRRELNLSDESTT